MAVPDRNSSFTYFHPSVTVTDHRIAADHPSLSILVSIPLLHLYTSCAEVPSDELLWSHSIVPFTPLFYCCSFLAAAHSRTIHNSHLEPDSRHYLSFHESILLFSL